MKLNIQNSEGKTVDTIDLNDEVFGGRVKTDLIWTSVVQENASERRGTHATKNRALVSGGGKKPYKQKGTGRARQGSLRSPQFRGGARIFGPVVRSHATDLPKKVRKLALKTALSSKQADGRLIVIDEAKIKTAKTKDLVKKLDKLGWTSALIIDGPTVDAGFLRAAINIPNVDVLPQQGANVYDILRRDTLILTKDAVQHLEARLK
jgi:large subunit ribosomal protein L4